MKQRILILITAATLAGTTLPVRADDPTTLEVPDNWRFSVTPILWAAGVNGNVTFRGNRANLDVGADKILQHADGALMLYFELRKDKFGFFAQPNYLKLSGDGSAGPLHAHDTLNLWIFETGGFYQIFKLGEARPWTLDAIGGVRIWNLNNRLSLKDTGGTELFRGSNTKTLYDPIVGGRTRKYLTDKLSLTFRGDVGGFAISTDTSDFAWQALGLVGYDFNKTFSGYAGYRALALDKHNGTGVGMNGADLILNGAILGMEIRF